MKLTPPSGLTYATHSLLTGSDWYRTVNNPGSPAHLDGRLPGATAGWDCTTTSLAFKTGDHLHVVADLEPEGQREFALPAVLHRSSKTLACPRERSPRGKNIDIGTLLEKDVAVAYIPGRSGPLGLGRSNSVRKVRFAPKTQLVRVTFPSTIRSGRACTLTYPPRPASTQGDPSPGHPRKCGRYRCARRSRAAWRSTAPAG